MNQSILQSPFNLEKAIKYQIGSIVSREIFKNEKSTVTLFAFDRDQGLSPHKTPFDALVYILEGEAVITIDNKENQLKRGEIIHMLANVTHALKAIERFKMLLVMVKST